MKRATAGQRRHQLWLENPGPAVLDGDGGYTQSWAALSPAYVFGSLQQATAWNLERIAAGATTTLATATHVVSFPYHPQVTTKTRLRMGSRVFTVSGVINTGEKNIETVVVVDEQVP
jgi:head-tail adaptor